MKTSHRNRSSNLQSEITFEEATMPKASLWDKQKHKTITNGEAMPSAQTKRSIVMKTSNYLSNIFRGITVILLVSLFTTFGISQNITVSGTGAFSGTGTINVKGNINTSAAGAGVSIPGTVNLNGTATLQQLGVSGTNALTFATLNATGSIAKQADVNVAVTDALTVNITGALNLDIQAKTLTLGGTSTLTTGSINVTNAGSTVVYNSAGASQVALPLTYVGGVTLSGVSTKTFSGIASVANAFSHSGGNLSVNENLTVSGATPTFATIADVATTKTLTLSGTGAKTITTVTTTTGTGTIDNTGVSGLMTITNLTGNAGVINGGAGGATFTSAAANSGTITGGTGPVTFSSTLAQSGGTITAGAGDIAFNGIVTATAGTITSAAAGSQLDFNANVDNSSTAAITTTSTGEAFFSGSLNTTGLTFASGSLVTFDGTTQTVPAVTYGNLTIGGASGTKTGGASFAVAGNLIVNTDLNMFTNTATLSFANATSTVTGTNEVIGAVSRTHAFALTTAYPFNRSDVTASFAANEAADMTITMRPGVAPTGVGANYVARKYEVASTADLTTNNMDLKLYYIDSERNGTALTAENKMGIRKYDGTTLSKYSTNAGAYTRVDGTTNTIALTKLNQGLSGITEVSLVPITYETIAAGAWATMATWGTSADDQPAITDDAEVRHAVTLGAVATIVGLTITDDATYTGKLSVDGANFTATTITNNGGEVAVSTTRTLTVSGAFTNAAGSGTTPAELVTITGIGTLASVANSKVFTVATGGVANLSAAFTNNSGATLNTVGTGALTITGADLTNAGTIANAGTITVQ